MAAQVAERERGDDRDPTVLQERLDGIEGAKYPDTDIAPIEEFLGKHALHGGRTLFSSGDAVGGPGGLAIVVEQSNRSYVAGTHMIDLFGRRRYGGRPLA